MRTSDGDHLNPQDREALALAGDLRQQIQTWMARRAVSGHVMISPYTDAGGQPNVLVRMNAYLARALILSLAEQTTVPRPVQPPPPLGRDERTHRYRSP